MTDAVSLSEASRQLDVPYMTVYKRWRDGRIPYQRGVGGAIMVKLGDVLESLKDHTPRGSIVPVMRV